MKYHAPDGYVYIGDHVFKTKCGVVAVVQYSTEGHKVDCGNCKRVMRSQRGGRP